MRRPLPLLALAALIAPTADALAGKKQKGDEAATAETTTTAEAGAPAAAPPLVMQKSGVADIDQVFMKADAPLATLTGVREQMTLMKNNVNSALGLSAGTPFSDALADLQTKAEGKVNLAVSERGIPHLEAEEGVPENVDAAADAVNHGMDNLRDAMVQLSEIPGQLEEAYAAASAVDPTKVEATKVPKVTKVTNHNMKVLAQAQDEAQAVKVELDAMKTSIETTFKSM